jgi:hypothetical protein
MTTPPAPKPRLARSGLAEDLRLLADQLQRCHAGRGRWQHWQRRLQALRSFTAARFLWVLALGACAVGALSQAG